MSAPSAVPSRIPEASELFQFAGCKFVGTSCSLMPARIQLDVETERGRYVRHYEVKIRRVNKCGGPRPRAEAAILRVREVSKSDVLFGRKSASCRGAESRDHRIATAMTYLAAIAPRGKRGTRSRMTKVARKRPSDADAIPNCRLETGGRFEIFETPKRRANRDGRLRDSAGQSDGAVASTRRRCVRCTYRASECTVVAPLSPRTEIEDLRLDFRDRAVWVLISDSTIRASPTRDPFPSAGLFAPSVPPNGLPSVQKAQLIYGRQIDREKGPGEMKLPT